MKKIVSSILALAMALSLCTFSAQAGTAGYYKVSYEPISVASGDINELAVDDTFFAVVTLKGATGIFSGGVGIKWDETKLQLTRTNGNPASSLGNGSDSSTRIVTTATTTEVDQDTSEDKSAAALEENTAAVKKNGDVINEIQYEFSAAQLYLDDEGTKGFKDYEISGDATIIKLRFKVLKAENPSFTFTQTDLLELKADGSVPTSRAASSSFDALSFVGGSTPTVGVQDITPSANDDIEGNKIAYMGVAGEVDITAASTVDVTCKVEGKADVTRTFKNLLNALFNGSVEGKGTVKANKINFAVVYDAGSELFGGKTPTFTFTLN